MTTLYICSISTTGEDKPDTVHTYIPVVPGLEGDTLYSITISHLQKDGTWQHSGAPSAAIMATVMGQPGTAIDLADLPPTIRKRAPSLKPGNKRHWYSMEVDLDAPQPRPKPLITVRKVLVVLLILLVAWWRFPDYVTALWWDVLNH